MNEVSRVNGWAAVAVRKLSKECTAAPEQQQTSASPKLHLGRFLLTARGVQELCRRPRAGGLPCAVSLAAVVQPANQRPNVQRESPPGSFLIRNKKVKGMFLSFSGRLVCSGRKWMDSKMPDDTSQLTPVFDK